tara:strand:+ start:91 stop:300 length:210 start_codon:yes stop_codon:yes gene_type:complete
VREREITSEWGRESQRDSARDKSTSERGTASQMERTRGSPLREEEEECEREASSEGENERDSERERENE